MRRKVPPYEVFGLVEDMLSAPDLIADFDPGRCAEMAARIRPLQRLLLTGEGSSRLFPAKHAIRRSRIRGDRLVTHTESGVQSQGYALGDWAVLALSNSGRTSEVVRLLDSLRQAGHAHCYSVTAQPQSKLESLAHLGIVLQCGSEAAVAATKSVIEQALVCQTLVDALAGEIVSRDRFRALAVAMRFVLEQPIDPLITQLVARAGVIYFAGPNDGVAEELTLKANEIARKRADYLEGTYAAHGIEEVMEAGDVVVWVDPPAEYEEKVEDILVKGVGLSVLAIASRPTRFPTIQTPQHALSGYLYLAAGWNLLVEVGLTLGVHLDKPLRARKVGNEHPG